MSIYNEVSRKSGRILQSRQHGEIRSRSCKKWGGWNRHNGIYLVSDIQYTRCICFSSGFYAEIHIMFHTVRTVVFKHKAAKYHNFSVKVVWEVSLGLVKKIRTTEVITCTFYDFFWRKVLRNLKITRIQRVSKFLSRKVKFSNTRQTNKITGNAMSAISNKEQAVQAVDCDIQWIIPVQHTIYPNYLLY